MKLSDNGNKALWSLCGMGASAFVLRMALHGELKPGNKYRPTTVEFRPETYNKLAAVMAGMILAISFYFLVDATIDALLKSRQVPGPGDGAPTDPGVDSKAGRRERRGRRSGGRRR